MNAENGVPIMIVIIKRFFSSLRTKTSQMQFQISEKQKHQRTATIVTSFIISQVLKFVVCFTPQQPGSPDGGIFFACTT